MLQQTRRKFTISLNMAARIWLPWKHQVPWTVTCHSDIVADGFWAKSPNLEFIASMLLKYQAFKVVVHLKRSSLVWMAITENRGWKYQFIFKTSFQLECVLCHKQNLSFWYFTFVLTRLRQQNSTGQNLINFCILALHVEGLGTQHDIMKINFHCSTECNKLNWPNAMLEVSLS